MLPLLCAFFGDTAGARQGQEPVEETRMVSLQFQSYNTREKADEVLRRLELGGFNTITGMVYWNHAGYKSEHFKRAPWIEENPDFDPVRYMIDQSRARGWQFHAWFVNARVAGEDAVKMRDWLQTRWDGERHAERLDYTIPEVREREKRKMLEFIELYPDVDLIQFDYIRFPWQGGYSYTERGREVYREKTGIDPLDLRVNPEKFPPEDLERLQREWKEYCEGVLTQLIRDVRALAREIAPDVMIGAAVMGRPDWARTAMQPWDRWMEEGLLDMVKPMYYNNNPGRFANFHLPFWVEAAGFEFGRLVLPLGVPNDGNRGTYDDRVWARFAEEYPVRGYTPRDRRAAELRERGLAETYENWFFDQYRKIAREFQRRMHAENPKLHLGVMPARLNDRFVGPWVRVLGTPEVPAIMDNWDMYQGTGFTPRIVERRREYLEANPNILYVPWFAPNQFHPEQITHQAFHAAMKADGYSFWVLSMMTPGQRQAHLQLPHGYEPDDYWAAFGEANRMVREALAAGSPRPEEIEFVEVERLAPAIDLSKIRIPNLEPAGSGEGEPRWMRLRNYQVVYLWAESGDPIRFELRHRIRNRLIQYYLLDPDGNELHNEIILPDGRQDLTIPAPRTGVHAFVVSGGTEAGAIYDLRFPNTRHLGVATDHPPLNFAYPFSAGRTYYIARRDPDGPASVRVRMGPRQVGRVVVNGEREAVGETGDTIQVEVPGGREVHEVGFMPPVEPWENRYTADFRVTLHGSLERLLFPHPERRLRSVE